MFSFNFILTDVNPFSFTFSVTNMNDDLHSNDDVNDDAVMSALAMHSSGTRSTRRSRRRPKVNTTNSILK